jgi:hypothetical protein
MPLPANFQLAQRRTRRPPTASPLRFARNPATTQRNLVRDQLQTEQGQIADLARLRISLPA